MLFCLKKVVMRESVTVTCLTLFAPTVKKSTERINQTSRSRSVDLHIMPRDYNALFRV